ncbi:MAG: PadR family transcriptional regulator, partial [Candidatus Coproplasma sp.]
MFDDKDENEYGLTEDTPSEVSAEAEIAEEKSSATVNDFALKSDGETSSDTYSEEKSAPETESKNQPEEGNSISADLIRGHINTIILRALYERDKYGYEIINDIESKSHGQYTLKQPTLYSALKRLENQGYIKAYWKTDEVTLGGRRKYFTLTESGKAITEKNLSEWEYSRTIIDSLISDKSF